MTDVAVLVPEGVSGEAPALEGTLKLTYGAALDLVVSLRALANPAVILSDGLAEDALDAVAAAVRDHSAACIEVRLERWDGHTFSPLSAACRGVISGFGMNGVGAAVSLLRAS